MSNAEARPFPGRWLLREPLLQFMALGALIFLAYAALAKSTASGAKERILVDDAVVSRLSMLYEKQFGRAPEEDELQQLIQNHIREQVLYREALRLHLDENDEIVRRRLVQKMEFLAAQPAQEPSEAELRAYYAAHTRQFVQPARVSFTHLYFSPDRGGADAAASRAAAALRALRNERSRQSAAVRGDAFPLQAQYSSLTKADAVRIFGSTQIVDALFSSPVGTWSGPYASGYGWHLVRIDQRADGTAPSFENAADQVSAAYRSESAERRTQEAIRQMSARYEIVRSARASTQ